MLGSLDDSNVIARASHEADAVIDTAEANHAGVVEAIASALRGSGKPFLHTSGSGIVATVTNGERSDSIYDEYSSFTPTTPRMLGFGGKTRQWSSQEAEAALGPKAHSAFGSNRRVRGKRSRAELGWQPKGPPILEEMCSPSSKGAAFSRQLQQLHILVIDRQVVDAAIGRRDPARHLPRLDDSLH